MFVGPWDLGNNLGYPVKGDFEPELKTAIARIMKAAHDAGKKSGIYCPNGEYARNFADDGKSLELSGRMLSKLTVGRLPNDIGDWRRCCSADIHDPIIINSKRFLGPHSCARTQGSGICFSKSGVSGQKVVAYRFTLQLVQLHPPASPHLRR